MTKSLASRVWTNMPEGAACSGVNRSRHIMAVYEAARAQINIAIKIERNRKIRRIIAGSSPG